MLSPHETTYSIRTPNSNQREDKKSTAQNTFISCPSQKLHKGRQLCKIMIADGTAGHKRSPRLYQVDSPRQSKVEGRSRSRSRLILTFLFVVALLSCIVFSETVFLMPFSRSLTNTTTEKCSLIPKGSKTGEINRIVLIGERHSGTSYTTSMLRKCFPTLEVDDFFLRYKHWFQPTPEFIINVTTQEILNQDGVVKAVNDSKVMTRWPKIAALDDPKSAFENTILITMFRNPYDWMEAMRVGPHHWPNHFRSISRRNPESKRALVEFFPWKRFVAANMTLTGTYDDATVGPKLCQNGYAFGTVSPCRKSLETYPPEVRKDYQSDFTQMPDILPYSASHPIYELRSDGTPFNHPLELRAAKIRDFLDIPNHWNLGGFMTLQHEDINMKGSAFLLEQVSKIAGVNPSCEPDPPKHQESKQLDPAWTAWISEHADWKSEGLVGYERRSKVIKAKNEGNTTVVPVPKEKEVLSALMPLVTSPEVSKPGSPIRRIILIGERHSGTSYTTELLRRCFPRLNVDDFFVRFKHWFQPTPEFIVNVTSQVDIKQEGGSGVDMAKVRGVWQKLAANKDPKSAFENTLLITMFRNPYDWMEAMRVGPHHWPNHFRSISPRNPEGKRPLYEFFPWQQFVAANMTLAYDDVTVRPKLCQNGYPFGTVSPCHKSLKTYPPEVRKDYQTDLSEMPDILPFSGTHPIYELRSDGTPFKHPLELRAAKIRDFLDIPNHWNLGGFMTLQHEDINMKGSAFLLEQVSEIVGMKPSCEPDPPKRQKLKQLNPAWTAWISEHADWKSEGLVGYERRSKVIKAKNEGNTTVVPVPKEKEVLSALMPLVTSPEVSKPGSPIRRIILIGERHSGTSYTTELLRRCFPRLNVDDFFVRFKHWFQPTPEFIVNVTSQLDIKQEGGSGVDMAKVRGVWQKLAANKDPKSAFENTLLITMFRNPYDWMEAMRVGPHHWPNHFRSISPRNPEGKRPLYEFFPWQQFVAANMTLAYDDVTVRPKLCQNGYPFGTVSPCHKSLKTYPPEVRKDYQTDLSEMPDILPFSGTHPIYELRSDGTPFKHPLELRAAKIRDFLDIPNHWNLGGFMTLQHEDINMKGSAFLLEQVSKIVGMKPSCEPDPPKRQKLKQLNPEWTAWISEHADWEAEASVGYSKREAR